MIKLLIFDLWDTVTRSREGNNLFENLGIFGYLEKKRKLANATMTKSFKNEREVFEIRKDNQSINFNY